MALRIKDLFKNDEDIDEMGTEDEYYSVSESDALKNADKAGNQMILLEPRSFSEAQAIADHLKTRNSVVVNLKNNEAFVSTIYPVSKKTIDKLKDKDK